MRHAPIIPFACVQIDLCKEHISLLVLLAVHPHLDARGNARILGIDESFQRLQLLLDVIFYRLSMLGMRDLNDRSHMPSITHGNVFECAPPKRGILMPMDPFQALIFGIVEGLSEFLPISSTGHLMLTQQLLGIPSSEFVKTFEIAIQLGAILAIVALYPRRLLMERATIQRIATAFVPTALLGTLLYPIIKSVFQEDVWIVLVSLFLGGVVLIFFERFTANRQTWTTTQMPYTTALLIGIFQSIAFIPGVSRSGATIVGSMLLGMEKTEAVEFSFLLAVPTMAAATGYDTLKHINAFTAANLLPLFIGFITSFVVAMVAVKYFLKFVSTHSFASFGAYRVVLALLMAAIFYL